LITTYAIVGVIRFCTEYSLLWRKYIQNRM